MNKRYTPWRSFFLLYPLLALIPIGILTGYSVWALSNRLETAERSERFAVDIEREAVATQLQGVVKDLCVLARQNELATLLLDDTSDARLAMAAEYLALARNSGHYDQIRYLDENGLEVVRVNYNAGAPALVDPQDLQDKSDRYYFADSMALEPGQIYVSPLDLNIEQGQIEIPYKPMIRLGTAVEDGDGNRRGVILINFLAQGMLDQVETAGSVSPGQSMMLNDKGYWLVTPNPPVGWGFMFPDRAEARMPEFYPKVWARMSQSAKGTIRSDQGIFTYDRYDPLERLDGCFNHPNGVTGAVATSGYPWLMASHLPQALINGWRRTVITQAFLIGVPLLVLLAVGTRAILLVTAERRRHREHMEELARFDPLTSLANRNTFEEHLREEIERGKRHQRRLAVLYLDLDGFKQINDTQGHKVGDEVLIQVAEVLKTSCRATDLAARQGGDEFAVLLSEVADASAATAVAEKIRSLIESLSWQGMGVGASIGIALCPDHCPDADTSPDYLLRLADEAMYRAKTAGKNRVTLAKS
ncbi:MULTISPECIES: sensor domain-containing diguanylate cyclase [Thiorhodovibrio]|uniref:sensor domain-containing diguanylate cyclase n=1 Tax=Thiorhodovibrio TaxID=61593 RepID=UPI00191126CF|nr:MULTISPECIES: sensor domain-containing diguanylate cyclase [Thiorhodovibrio]WPL14871.1 Diguanylate cyclase DosC [Thiorhodovibrio litoralis]